MKYKLCRPNGNKLNIKLQIAIEYTLVNQMQTSKESFIYEQTYPHAYIHFIHSIEFNLFFFFYSNKQGWMVFLLIYTYIFLQELSGSAKYSILNKYQQMKREKQQIEADTKGEEKNHLHLHHSKDRYESVCSSRWHGNKRIQRSWYFLFYNRRLTVWDVTFLMNDLDSFNSFRDFVFLSYLLVSVSRL